MGVGSVVAVLAVVVGVLAVGYGARVVLRDRDRWITAAGYALFGAGVGGYALGRLLGEDWGALTWLALGGPVVAYVGNLPAADLARGRGRRREGPTGEPRDPQ